MWQYTKLLRHEFEGYVHYSLSDIVKKYPFRMPKFFGKYFELRKSTWVSSIIPNLKVSTLKYPRDVTTFV